jgi:CheY-like chemotaxis protein
MGVRVLLVEDHTDTQEMYRRVLTDEGATVAATGHAAAAAMLLATVDVVVTDVALPGDDGVWLLERARAKTPGVPVIGVSGYAKEQLAETAAAFDLLLLKPVDPWDLVDRIVEVLRDRSDRSSDAGFPPAPPAPV